MLFRNDSLGRKHEDARSGDERSEPASPQFQLQPHPHGTQQHLRRLSGLGRHTPTDARMRRGSSSPEKEHLAPELLTSLTEPELDLRDRSLKGVDAGGGNHVRRPASSRGGVPARPTKLATWASIGSDGGMPSRNSRLDRNHVRRLTGVHPRDLRVMDPSLAYPSSIMIRERALVVNLEHVKAVITADFMLLQQLDNPLVERFLERTTRRLVQGGGEPHARESGIDGSSDDAASAPGAEDAQAQTARPHSFALPRGAAAGISRRRGNGVGAVGARVGRQSEQLADRGSFGGSFEIAGTIAAAPSHIHLPAAIASAAGGAGSAPIPPIPTVGGGGGLPARASAFATGRKPLPRLGHFQNLSTSSLPSLLAKEAKEGVSSAEKKRRSSSFIRPYSNDSNDSLAFELRALECCLQEVVDRLCTDVDSLARSALPVFDALARGVSKSLLEKARRMKTQVARLANKVENVHDELEKLLDSETELIDMCLTRKKQIAEAAALDEYEKGFDNDQGYPQNGKVGTPLLSPRRDTNNAFTHAGERDVVEDLENMIEEYISNTEDYVQIELDSHRNQLIQLDLLLTIGTLCVGIYATIGSLFGMNASFTGPDYYDLQEDGEPGLLTFKTIVLTGFLGCSSLF
ncbi:hypothetical protein T492DRAFT_913211, partial [Pavlovales sp. CCMP2436]